MMVVAMMTPRAMLALRRAAIIGVRHVFAALHLMRDRVTERPWTAFPVAPDLAVLKEAEGAAPLRSPFTRSSHENRQECQPWRERKRIIPQNGSAIRFASSFFNPFSYNIG